MHKKSLTTWIRQSQRAIWASKWHTKAFWYNTSAYGNMARHRSVSYLNISWGILRESWEVTPRAYVSSLSTRLKIIASDRLWRFISLFCFRMGNQINTHRLLGNDEHFLDWLPRSYELDCIVKPDRLRHDQLFDHQSHYTAFQIGCDNDYQFLCGLVIQGRLTAST